MSTTVRDIITLALKEAGVISMGQTANDEDINDGFTLFSRMLAQWQNKRWLVPGLTDISAVANGSISNTIGSGQYYNTLRPDKILSAYFKQLNSGDVSYPLTPIWSREDYSKIALKSLNSWPSYYFYDNAFPIGNVFIWPVPSSTYEIHLIVKMPINVTTAIESGTISDGGAGYIDGVYTNIALTGGSGTGATAELTVAGGLISNVSIINGGKNYLVGNTLSVNEEDIGGGSGFVWIVGVLTNGLDSEIILPDEYLEPIHYNLCIRLVSMYQLPINPVQGKLAITSLNVLRNSNSQISQLQMPNSLKNNNGSGFYIFNADQQ